MVGSNQSHRLFKHDITQLTSLDEIQDIISSKAPYTWSFILSLTRKTTASGHKSEDEKDFVNLFVTFICIAICIYSANQ